MNFFIIITYQNNVERKKIKRILLYLPLSESPLIGWRVIQDTILHIEDSFERVITI